MLDLGISWEGKDIACFCAEATKCGVIGGVRSDYQRRRLYDHNCSRASLLYVNFSDV